MAKIQDYSHQRVASGRKKTNIFDKKTIVLSDLPEKTHKVLKAKRKRMSRLTKARMEEKRHFWRMLCVCLMILALTLFAFNFSLVSNGGWDDLNNILLFLSPGLAVTAFLVARRNKRKYQTGMFELWTSYFMVVISSLAYCFELLMVMLLPQFAVTVDDSGVDLIGTYNCAPSEEMKNLEQFTVNFKLDEKEFEISDYSDREIKAIGSYGVVSGDGVKYDLRSIIKENKATDDSLGFGETSYTLSFGSETVKITADSEKIVRYCVKQ